MNYCIYEISTPFGFKYYGMTKNPSSRFLVHIKRPINLVIRNEIMLHGSNSVKFTIIHNQLPKLVSEFLERYLIDCTFKANTNKNNHPYKHMLKHINRIYPDIDTIELLNQLDKYLTEKESE